MLICPPALSSLCFWAVHRHAVPRLHYKHDQTREVGTIDSLSYDDHGALTITATVTDPLARRANAFCVGCTVVDYELINAETPDFYALIRQATLDEISLTDTQPIRRHRHAPSRCMCDGGTIRAAQQHVARLTKMITLIRKEPPCRISPLTQYAARLAFDFTPDRAAGR